MKKEVTIQTTPASEPKKIMVDENGGVSGFIGKLDEEHSLCFAIENGQITDGKIPFAPNYGYEGFKTIQEFVNYVTENGINLVALRYYDPDEDTHVSIAYVDVQPENVKVCTNLAIPGHGSNAIEHIFEIDIEPSNDECVLYKVGTYDTPAILKQFTELRIFCLK